MHLIAVGVLIVSLASGAITRCGPYFGMQGCPYNADGVSGVMQYCSRYGFCGTTDLYKQQQIAGHYIFSRTLDGSISPDDVCIGRPDPNAFCNKIFPGATCSKSDTRCELFNIAPANLDPIGNYELVVVRCGPFFQNMACPVNADGKGTVQYCSKFGFCGTSTDFFKAQAKGHYVMSRTLDGSVDPGDVCTQDPSPNSFCAQFHANATCNKVEMRCELFNVNSTSFQKYRPGVWTLPPIKTMKVSLAAGSNSDGQSHSGKEDTSSASSLSLIMTLAALIAIAFQFR